MENNCSLYFIIKIVNDLFKSLFEKIRKCHIAPGSNQIDRLVFPSKFKENQRSINEIPDKFQFTKTLNHQLTDEESFVPSIPFKKLINFTNDQRNSFVLITF